MPIGTQIYGKDNKQVAHLVKRNGDTGLLVYTDAFVKGTVTSVPFFNATFGADMNQNVSFAGTPEGIHDGTDSTLWTAAAGAGTWDFADTTAPAAGTKHISITAANDLDSAVFSDATEINMSNYTAITGQVRLEAFNGALNDIDVQMSNNGLLVGNSVSINDYITTSLLGVYQGFVIPKEDLGVAELTVDQMTIVIRRSVGGKPTVYFDSIQIEETGNPLAFKVSAAAGEIFHVTHVIMSLADTGTGGAAYAYNKIGAISSLANGIVFSAIIDGETIFSASIKQLSDFLNAVGNVTNLIDDGTNTFYNINIDLSLITPIVLDSREGDEIIFTINDDLSGLDLFIGVASGFKEKIAK